MYESGVQVALFPPCTAYSTFETPDSPYSVTGTVTGTLVVVYQMFPSIVTPPVSDTLTVPITGFCVSATTVLVTCFSLPEIS